MVDIKEKLIEIFSNRTGGPFLFIGSGFSRRYLGLEDWKGLLSRFCVTGKPFEYYLSAADGDYPTAAKLLAVEFNEHWWASDDYKTNVERFKSKVKSSTSALRIEICQYLATLDQAKAKDSIYADEVKVLSTLNVDGVITTNWDMFIEQIFPDYKPYVGQNELLFSNPQQIGEIYKIHGCASNPESIILTNDDYTDFNNKNAYLASKLITIFVEHPVIFIGYSLSDGNIKRLLSDISSCIGDINIEQLRRNLIFIQRTDPDDNIESLSETYITIEGVQIPIILIKTDNFLPVYEAIATTKRKIPARVLRYCKEQLYELVKSSEPENKICVVDIDAIDRKEDIEFLVGVGVVSQHESTVSQVGYAAIENIDLMMDVLHDDSNYEAQLIVDNVLKRAAKNTKYVPVFKYLRAIGINNNESYENSSLELDKLVKIELKEFRLKQYIRPFSRYRHSSMKEVIEKCTPENAAVYIPHFPSNKIDLDVLKSFLIHNEEKLKHSSYASYFRKLVVLYDKLKYGWQS